MRCDLHKLEKWSLEHIHAQNSEDIKKKEDRVALLESQKKYVDDFYTSISGYNAGATQTLKNIAGVLTWVTD